MNARDLAFATLLIPGVLAVLVPIALGRAREATRGVWRSALLVAAFAWFYAWWCGAVSMLCAAWGVLALRVLGPDARGLDAVGFLIAAWMALLGIGVVATHRVVFVSEHGSSSARRDRAV